MNSDRCYHVPTSPGQTICTCKDYQMWLEMLVALQARYIDVLTKRAENHSPEVIIRDLG